MKQKKRVENFKQRAENWKFKKKRVENSCKKKQVEMYEGAHWPVEILSLHAQTKWQHVGFQTLVSFSIHWESSLKMQKGFADRQNG